MGTTTSAWLLIILGAVVAQWGVRILANQDLVAMKKQNEELAAKIVEGQEHHLLTLLENLTLKFQEQSDQTQQTAVEAQTISLIIGNLSFPEKCMLFMLYSAKSHLPDQERIRLSNDISRLLNSHVNNNALSPEDAFLKPMDSLAAKKLIQRETHRVRVTPLGQQVIQGLVSAKISPFDLEKQG